MLFRSASTFPLDAEHSTDAAVGFYRGLAAGRPPEEALTAERPEADWCWAFLELWARPGALGGTRPRAAFQFVSPYRGLSSFAEQDADLFFGRKAEVAELLQILRAEPAVGVVGDSGSGKTSLLQAGLASAVRRDGLAGLDGWRIVSPRPGYRPALSLVAAVFGGSRSGESVSMDPKTLRASIDAALRTDERPLLVIFDQFEEVFTLARDRAEVQLLTDALADAVERQRDRFRLILGMRSEFLGQAASVPRLSRLIRRPWVLRPPGAADMRDIVAGPAEQCGYTFQGPLSDGNPSHAVGLLDRILADPLLIRGKGGESAPLPLLQFALERLWLKAVEKGGTEFTHAVFDEIGGMGQAIAQHAEAVYQAAATATEAGPKGRVIAEQVITALVSARGTRLPRPREELQAETGSPDAAKAVVDYLVGERLLTVRSDPEDMTRSLLDLSHEALIQNWERLKGWLAEDPQGRAMREEFRTAAEKWEAGFAGVPPRSRFALPGADVARNYITWIVTSQPRLAPVQQEFVQAMGDMLTRQRRRRQVVIASLMMLTAAASLLALYADAQAGRARTAATAANTSADEARASEAQAKAEKRSAELKSATLALDKGIQLCEQGRARLGILAIAYSLDICPPDARDLRRVILTNLAALAPFFMCLDDVRKLPREAIAADSGGKYALLARIADKVYVDTVQLILEFQLFDIDTVQPAGPPFRAEWHKPDRTIEFRHPVERAKLLPSGVALLTGGGHSSAWNALTGKPVGKWVSHGPGVAAISPDGKLVAGCSGAGDMRVYDAATGVARPGVARHQGRVSEVVFSADGRLIATGCGRRADKIDNEKGGDGSAPVTGGVVHLYEVGATPTTPTKLKWRDVLPTVVTCVQISPDGKRVTGGGFELRSWEATGDGRPIPGSTRYSPESIARIEFDPDPKHPSNFLACNPSGSLQIMNEGEDLGAMGERLSPQGWLAGVGFRPDGRVFTANSDGTVRVWNRPRLGDPRKLSGEVFAPPNAEAVLCVAFHPNGRAIALGSRTGLVFVYDLARPGMPPKEFRCAYPNDRRQPVTTVRFSTDGGRVIAHDQMLRTFVFDAAGGQNPVVAKGGQRPLGVADDGRTAVFESRTVTPYVIGPLDPKADVPDGPTLNPGGGLATLADEADNWFLVRAARVAFTPDRSLVALLNSEGMVRVFRTATGEAVGGPLEHEVDGQRDGIHAVEFCPRGEHLLTRSPRARGIWAAATGAPVNYLTNRIGIQVARFSPGGKYVLGGTNYSQADVWTCTGEPAVPAPLAHTAQVWSVAADPSEERILTASFDRTARLWDRATGRPLSYLAHKAGVSEAAFSPDGQFTLTGCWDGTARLRAIPRALDNQPERVRAWVETMTGLRIGPNAGGELLHPDEWQARKAELDRLGGPPSGY